MISGNLRLFYRLTINNALCGRIVVRYYPRSVFFGIIQSGVNRLFMVKITNYYVSVSCIIFCKKFSSAIESTVLFTNFTSLEILDFF